MGLTSASSRLDADLFASEFDLAGRRVLSALVDLDPRGPVHRFWDGHAKIRVPLLRGWPFRPFDLVLRAKASESPTQWVLALELPSAGDGAFARMLAGWSAPNAHDATTGWTHGAGDYAGRVADVDGVAIWNLASSAGEPVSVRVVSTLAHIFDLDLGPAGSVLGVRAPTGRVDVETNGGRLTRVRRTTAQGTEELARLSMDESGLARSLERPGHPPVRLDYDAAGRPTSVVASSGAELRYTYLGESVDAEGYPERVGAVRVESSVLGRWEVTHAQGIVTAVDADRGTCWFGRFDGAGRLLEERDPNGVQLSIERDAESGAPVELQRGAYRRHFYYDPDGFIVLADDSNGLATELRYDEVGRLVLVQQGERQRLRRAFDLTGRLVAWSCMDAFVEVGWNELGQCAHVREGGSGRGFAYSDGKLVYTVRGDTAWRAERDAAGDIKALHGPEGETLSVRHSQGKRLDEWRSADGFARSFTWTGDALGGYRDASDERVFERDDAGRLSGVADHGVWVEHVEGARRVCGAGVDEAITALSARSARVTRTMKPGEPSIELLTYDDLGRLTGRKAGGRADITLAWSPAGQLASVVASEVVPDTSGYGSPSVYERRWEFTHDDGGHLVRASVGDDATALRRSGGRVVEEVTASDRLAITRSESGHRVHMQSSRGLELEHHRDAQNRVVKLVARDGGAEVEIEIGYDRAGRELVRCFGEVEIQFLRDSLGRVTRRRVSRRGQVVSYAEYSYRGARLASIQGADDASLWRFEHDRAGTLRRLWEGATERPTGAVEGPHRGHAIAGCTYDAAGRPLVLGGRVFTHDVAGRRVLSGPAADLTRYTYDPFNRLIAIEGAARRITHVYDALGRRTSTTLEPAPRVEQLSGPAEADATSSFERPVEVRPARTEYVWDGELLLHRADSTGERTTYVYADGLLVAELLDGVPYAVLPGLTGDVDGLLAPDGSGVFTRRPEALLFGTTDRGILRYRAPALPGHHLDPLSGLWFGSGGDLDPETGRYLTPSPFGVGAGPWQYALPPDPMRCSAPRQPIEPYVELTIDTFDVVWRRAIAAELYCSQDSAGQRAWGTLTDGIVLGAERLLLVGPA